MEEQDNDNDYVLVFDHFYTNNHIQIMKTLLPYIDSAAMPMLPVMIKYMELQYTMKLIRKSICIFSITGYRLQHFHHLLHLTHVIHSMHELDDLLETFLFLRCQIFTDRLINGLNVW